MEEEALEKALSANLSRINEWLRFAETKNAALLTFSSAWLVAVCTLWSNQTAPALVRVPLLLACPTIIIAAAISIISLLPHRQTKNTGETARNHTTRNLLFHGNVSSLDISTALNSFNSRYKPSTGKKVASGLLDDLATQLVETSIITKRKYSLFNRGAKFILASLIIATLAIPVVAVASAR